MIDPESHLQTCAYFESIEETCVLNVDATTLHVPSHLINELMYYA